MGSCGRRLMASGVYYPIRHDRLTYTPMRNNLYCYKKWFMKTPQNTSTIVKIILNHSKWIYDLKLNKSTLSPGEFVFWLANQWRFVLLVGETVMKFLLWKSSYIITESHLQELPKYPSDVKFIIPPVVIDWPSNSFVKTNLYLYKKWSTTPPPLPTMLRPLGKLL
jgi:hypothetical protein